MILPAHARDGDQLVVAGNSVRKRCFSNPPPVQAGLNGQWVAGVIGGFLIATERRRR